MLIVYLVIFMGLCFHSKEIGVILLAYTLNLSFSNFEIYIKQQDVCHGLGIVIKRDSNPILRRDIC